MYGINNPGERARLFGYRRAAFLAQSSETRAHALTSGLAVTPWATTLRRTVQPAVRIIVSLPGSFSSKTRTAKTIVASPRGPNQPLSASARIESRPRAHPLQRYQGLVWVGLSRWLVSSAVDGFDEPRMAARGHEERFPPPRLSGRYGSESSLLLSRIDDRDF
jgi:hypothetical protein